MANEILVAKSYLMLITESSWGTKPSTPDRIYTPVESYDVRLNVDSRQAKPHLGIFQRKHMRRFKGMPSGTLVANMYAFEPTPTSGATGSDIGESLAEYLMNWSMCDEAATIHEASALPSKTAEWAEGPDTANKEHNGLRVNQATLSGSADSGVLQLSLDLMGKTEVALATADALPADVEELSEMEFANVIFKLDDGAGGALSAIELESFEIQVQHALLVRYNNSRSPSLILKTDRMVTFSVTIDKNADTYDVVMRNLDPSAEKIYVGELTIQGVNAGTGAAAWTKGIITFNAMEFQDNPEQGGRDDILQEQLSFICLKPDSSSLDMAIVWSTSASAAT